MSKKILIEIDQFDEVLNAADQRERDLQMQKEARALVRLHKKENHGKKK